MTSSNQIILNSEEAVSIEQHVKNSELVKEVNKFDYKLNDKAVKAKLLKAAKRQPIEVEENSTSLNLVSSAGAWVHAVLPSVKYWKEVQDAKTCKIGDYTIRIGGIKEGKENKGKHVNTQVVFLADRDKIVCHLYNTTQLILVNGHGYKKFVDLFLKPFLESKINSCLDDIEEFNNQVVKNLGPKTVKRADIKLKKGPLFPCHNCDFISKSAQALKKHRREEHILGLDMSNKIDQQKQSTRNNSLTEQLLIEDVTSSNLTLEEPEVLKETIYKYTCDTCEFVTKNKTDIDEHVISKHLNKDDEEVKYLCTRCHKEFNNVQLYENHAKIHSKEANKTDLTDLENLAYMSILEKFANEIPKENLIFPCDQCDFISGRKSSLNRHRQTVHQFVKVDIPQPKQKIKCEVCGKEFDLNIQLKNHTKRKHSEKKHSQLSCNLCELKADSVGELWNHKLSSHVGQPFDFNKSKETSNKDHLITLIAEQNMEIVEELINLKSGIKGILEQLITEFEDNMKIVQSEATKNKMEMIEMMKKVEKKVEQKSNSPPTASPVPAKSSPQKSDKRKEKPLDDVKKKCSDIPPPPSSSSTTSSKKLDSGSTKKKTEYQNKQRLLLVGDSLAHNTNFRILEEVTNTTIRSAKAYSSVFDNSARFKHQNITDVAKKELTKAPFNHLVLAAPTVDISNLNTDNVRAVDNVDDYKERVRKSCKNMMNVAQDALTSHPELMKVTIMNHAPRYDSSDVDPMGLKPILASFANSYFLELWLDSPMKNKIVIGSHSLECADNEKERRYTDERNGRWDGVHLYGRAGKAAYTDSVLNILVSSIQPQNPTKQKRASQTKNDNHTSCPQTKFKSKQKKLYSSAVRGNSGVKTQNRFSPLGSWSENC